MLKSIQDWVYTKTGVALNYTSIQRSDNVHFVVGLLIMLGKTDGDLSPEESAEIVTILRCHDRVRVKEALQTFAQAAKKTSNLSLEVLLNILNKDLTIPQKVECLQLLYVVMKADNQTKTPETEFIARVVTAWAVNETDHAQAYERALKQRAKNS